MTLAVHAVIMLAVAVDHVGGWWWWLTQDSRGGGVALDVRE